VSKARKNITSKRMEKIEGKDGKCREGTLWQPEYGYECPTRTFEDHNVYLISNSLYTIRVT
jgi:hypothetical protein